MSNVKDLSGLQFGRLLVLNEDGDRDKFGSVMWNCKCTCGGIVKVRSGNLIKGNTKSCGCLKADYYDEASINGLKRKNIVGNRYGRLFVTEFSHVSEDRHRTYWKCLCDCGNEVIVRRDSLHSGDTVSCGCYQMEIIRNINLLHGKSTTRMYNNYIKMIQRCYSIGSHAYALYGGQGIKVCDRWLGSDGFLNFYEDMGERPKGMSLDRRDNDGDYCPENCRWATAKEQARNRRTNIVVRHDGVSKTLVEWCEELGLIYQQARKFVNAGGSISGLLSLQEVVV